LNQAVKWEILPRNVALLVDTPSVVRPESKFLPPDEAKCLLNVIKTERLAALYTVALAVGLRKSEALGLRWQDINFETGTITVRVSLHYVNKTYRLFEPKSRSGRRQIALPEVALDALRIHRQFQDAEQEEQGSHWQDTYGLVFTTSHGTPLNGRNVTRSFHRMLKRAGLERMRFYDMRHTCASLLIALGVHPRVVMDILGHSQISLTMNTYGHVMPVARQDAADKMPSVLEPQIHKNED
jgi:integrase